MSSAVAAIVEIERQRLLLRRRRREAGIPHVPLDQYIKDTLGTELWGTQREIAESVDRYPRTTVRSCHSAGKSFSAARIALAYLQTHESSIVVTTAPTARQVQNILWRYINAAAIKATKPLRGRALQTRYEIAPDWYALGFKGDDTNSDAFQGFHSASVLVIVDEAAGVAETVMDAIEAILTGENSRLLLIGNPTSSSGAFRRSFHKDAHLYNTIRISAYDTPNFTTFGIIRDDLLTGAWKEKVGDHPMPYPALIDPSWVARQIALHGPDSAFVKSRIDAEFPDDAGDTLIPLSVIERADNSGGDLGVAPGTEYEAGVDVARFGDDETSIALRHGPVYLGQESWGKLDTMETADRVDRIIKAAEIPKTALTIKVDATGVGGGVADRLKQRGYRVRDVHAGSKSSDREKWSNLRHEMWWQLRERFVEGRIAPAEGVRLDEIAVGQLSDVKFKYLTGYTMPVIESKDEAKRRGVTSPDRAEAIMLAYATLPPGETRWGYVGTRVTKDRRG